MKRSLAGITLAIIIFALPTVVPAGQTDRLAGRWEGKLSSLQGERPTAAIFRKSGDRYTGRTLGLRPGMEIELKDLKVEGETITAQADVETPQATLTINYTFKLEGEVLKGQGSVDFGGQPFTFSIELKRVSGDTESPLMSGSFAAAARTGAASPARPPVVQPQQKQSADYFVGQWNFRYLGRESPLGMAPREGTISITQRTDGRTLEAKVAGRSDTGAYVESWVMVFDETSRSFTLTEKLANGVVVNARCDWSSPISINFNINPIKVGRHNLQLRRTISIIAAHSFSVTEEISENGAPFVRLGSAIYSRLESK
ncbi:MAG: hypothetical protein EBU88_00040 [Acidobacteria bacterium]|nr:hypothetical protein [Acidobacteriota bacterium]